MTKILLIGMTILIANFTSAENLYSCSDYKNIDLKGSCQSEFNGLLADICEVCREGNSCFKAINNKKERGLCQAYIEGRSCFLALGNSDRHWCQVLNEGGSCDRLRSDVDRFKCKHGEYPDDHNFWRF